MAISKNTLDKFDYYNNGKYQDSNALWDVLTDIWTINANKSVRLI